MNSRHRAIRVHIDELVLHGFSPCDRHAIADAVERELAALLGDAGVAAWGLGSRDLTRFDAGGFEVARDASAAAVGAGVAQAIHATGHPPASGARGRVE